MIDPQTMTVQDYPQVRAEPKEHFFNFCFLLHHPWTKWTSPIPRTWGHDENPFTGQKASSAVYPTQFRMCPKCGKQQARKIR